MGKDDRIVNMVEVIRTKDREIGEWKVKDQEYQEQIEGLNQ